MKIILKLESGGGGMDGEVHEFSDGVSEDGSEAAEFADTEPQTIDEESEIENDVSEAATAEHAAENGDELEVFEAKKWPDPSESLIGILDVDPDSESDDHANDPVEVTQSGS